MKLEADIDHELDLQVSRQFQQQIVGLKGFSETDDEDDAGDDDNVARATEQISSVKLTDAQLVRPGDLITADFINKLLGRLARLEAIIGLGGASERGTFAMPYFFGVGLAPVLEGLASRGLKLRKIVDVSGRVVADSAKATFSISEVLALVRRLAQSKDGVPIVLGQYPVPKARVRRGEMVSLLINLRGVTDDATSNNVAGAEVGNTLTFSAPAAGTKTTKRSARKTKTAGKTTDTTPVVPG
jgi:hypothetical protein